MSTFRNFQTNFSGGLLSESMLGRVDLAQYENGCKQHENWWPKITGGARRRPGSIYLNEREHAKRIESFIFSEDQVYLFAFWNDPLSSTDGISIYDNDTGALIQFLDTSVGWTDDIIKEMSITQTADVMFLAHPDWTPQVITRTSATTFVITQFSFESKNPADGGAYPLAMPFIKYEGSEVTISVSNYTEGSVVTVTASAAVFADRHVNRAIRYRGKQIYITAVGTPGGVSTTCTGTILEDLDRGAVLTFAGTPTNMPQDFLIDEIIVGRTSGIKAQVIDKSATTITIAMIAGVFPAGATEEIEGLTSGNRAVITANTNVNPVAHYDWDEEAFSPTHGFPGVIEFHAQRLWLAGSSSLPAHIFGSRVAGFFNFDVGDAFPADSIQVVIADKQVNLITDIVSGRHLQVFTNAGEFYAPQSDDLPLIPETFDLRKQTRYGSNVNIEPKLFDEATIFVQAQGNAIREFVWVDGLRGYSSDPISLLSEEFLNDIQEVEVLYGGYDRPEQIAFFVNGDGTIIWYHAARAESIRAWGKWTTQGSYKSICVIQDKLYALVDRVIEGVTVSMLERFELDVTLDSAVQVTDTSKSVWTGDAPHLTGKAVQVGTSVVQANHDPDYYLGEFTYTADALDLTPISRDNITIGLGFTQTLETMPIEVKDPSGISGGMPKRLISADVYIASTLAIQLQGNRISTFVAPADFSVRPDAITGLRKFYLLGYNERPTLTIVNDIPVPCEALAVGAEVEY